MYKLKRSEQDEKRVRLIPVAGGPKTEDILKRTSSYQCRCTEAKTNPAVLCRPHVMLGFIAEGRH